MGRQPEKFSIRLQPTRTPETGLFAKYEIPFTDPAGVDHARLGQGLKKALYNYLHGIGIDEDVRAWFDDRFQKPLIRAISSAAL